MANIMSSFKLRNKPSRNGFDLSNRNSFTAKVGELLPVLCEECLPGDKFKINLTHFSRTQPLTSPAYVRIKEYYDFVFVPYRLLWRYVDSFMVQMPNYESASGFLTEQNTFTRHPYLTANSVNSYLYNTLSQVVDELGNNRALMARKLLEYLNYGEFNIDPNSLSAPGGFAINPFPLLAYQKAYADIYRFDQWEKAEPHTYNVDYMSNPASMEISLTGASPQDYDHDMFSLRYANYPKDLFMGVLPNSQFGDVSIISTTNPGVSQLFASQSNPGQVVARKDSTNLLTLGATGTTLSYKSNIDQVFNFSILALRQAEFLQKWKEVAQTAKQDYRDQIKAHWNVNVSKARSQQCEYLGGVSSNVQINGEVNTNLVSGQSIIRGTAISANRGMIDYEVPEHGILMCIYHACPLLDYNGFKAIAPFNFKTLNTDYAIPEMDKTGMQLVPVWWFNGYEQLTVPDNWIGYAPRYIDYKTDVDRTHGSFNKGYKNWVAPWDSQYSVISQQSHIDYTFFKIIPGALDDVFGVNSSADVDTDQLLCNANFDVKVVRNLDTNGMPY